jgi:hypothetical protein
MQVKGGTKRANQNENENEKNMNDLKLITYEVKKTKVQASEQRHARGKPSVNPVFPD